MADYTSIENERRRHDEEFREIPTLPHLTATKPG